MESDRPGRSTRSAPRRILHVDVDAMFVQCAVIADPERLAGESLILVGGSPTGRGVVTSASYGCRAFGVRSAMPMSTALRLCPAALVVPVPGQVVRQKSQELSAVLDLWSPLVMKTSVDEAYLDLSGTERLYQRRCLEDVARDLRADVLERTGLSVSIGGGSNRLIAKLATSFAKPAGVHVVAPGEEESFVGGLALEDLIGVGPALLADLRRRGVSSIASLRALDRATMGSWWGDDRAAWFWRMCRGIDDAPLTPSERARSVSSERTFARDLDDDLELERALLSLVVRTATSLRAAGSAARTVTVKVRYRDFEDRSRGRTVPEPVRTERVLFDVARDLLRDLRRTRADPVRLIGVGLSNLTAGAEEVQGTLDGLSPSLEGERDRKLADAVDRIRAKHGKVIGPGRLIGGATPESGDAP